MPVQMRRRSYLWQLIAAVIAFSLLLTSPALAIDYTWAGGSGPNWGTAANWTSASGAGVPGVGDTARFNFATNLTLAIAHQVDGIIVNTNTVTFNGAPNLTTGVLSAIVDTSISKPTAGRLIVTGSFGHGVNNVVLDGFGDFEVQGTNNITGAGNITLTNNTTLYLNGSQTLRVPNIAHGAGTTISLSNNALLTIYQTGAPAEYQGVISGAGSFRKQGDEDLTLSGLNTYTGSTTVSSGLLIAGGAGDRLPSTTTLNIAAGAECNLGLQNLAGLTGSGTLRLIGAVVVFENGTQTFSGNITEVGGHVFYQRGTGTLTLTGSVVVDLQVWNGTLVINGSADDSINALTGGTLMGTGVATGNVTIQDGTFRPGNSIGTFNVAPAFTLNAASTLGIEVGGGAADQVNVTGSVSLGGSTLTVTGTPTIGSVFTIINNDLADPVGGTFAGVNFAEGATFTSGGHDYEITYIGGDGNDVVLTALTGTPPSSGGGTPEPAPAPNTLPAPKVSQGSGPSPIGSLDGSTLTWPHVKGSSYYRVYRADCPVCKRKEIGRVKDNNFSDATAIAGQPYYYWLRTENADGLGPYSNWMTAWRYEQNPGRAGDFNGDGIMDLLWWNPENNQLSIWFMNNGAVTSASAPGDGLNIAEWLLIATADFNGDGACDLLWWKPETGETKVWYLDKAKAMAGGDGEWLVKTSADLEAITGHATMAYPGDLNGDGRADILWRDYSNGDVTVWLMGEDGRPLLNGPPTPASEDITKGERPGLSGGLGWQVIGLSDSDGNGRADVIWKDARNNRLATWTMDASTISGVIQENKGLDVVWRSVGLGDLNMDSQADLVWRNEASGQVAAWLMQGGLFSEERVIVEGSEDTTKWQVKAVGDFCAPGCDDIYCKHSETSAARIVKLDGQEFTPTVE